MLIRHEIDILPKQMAFLRCESREVLYSGAVGAGKTRAVCLKVAMRASVPGAREGLCRKHLVTLKATTLKTLLEGDGPKAPPILPPGSYEHNKAEKTINIFGGGQIAYFGFDDPQKVGSYNLSGCGVDEVVELDEADWQQADWRVRVEVPGVPLQLYGACNPGPPSHFLATRFGLIPERPVPMEGCASIHTRSADNTFLSAKYLNALSRYTGLAKARFVDGLWVGSEGLVYDRWDRRQFVIERTGPWNRIIVGQDEGYTNPAVMLVVGEDGDGRLHVIGEWYETRKLEADVIAEAMRVNALHRPEAFIVDPSAAKLRAAMLDRGLPVRAADNAVFAGIQAVQQRLVVPGDGRPRLTVDPSCVETIREFETYEWRPGRDEPVKEHDHTSDAIRYVVMHVDRGMGIGWTQAALDQTPTRIY